MKVFTTFTSKSDGDIKQEGNIINFLNKNNLQSKTIITMKQQHTNRVCIVDENYEPQICDAIITQRKDVILLTRVADCQPVLMYDEVNQVVAAVHAGREGVFKDIAKETLSIFQNQFDSDLGNIKVIIGPSAQKCCYEVGATSNKHINYVVENFGQDFVYAKNIDLPDITVSQLLKSGIDQKNIQISNICSICNSDTYFSYRKGDLDKRFAGVIALI